MLMDQSLVQMVREGREGKSEGRRPRRISSQQPTSSHNDGLPLHPGRAAWTPQASSRHATRVRPTRLAKRRKRLSQETLLCITCKHDSAHSRSTRPLLVPRVIWPTGPRLASTHGPVQFALTRMVLKHYETNHIDLSSQSTSKKAPRTSVPPPLRCSCRTLPSSRVTWPR